MPKMDEGLQRTTRLFCQAVLFRVIKPALEMFTSEEDLTQVQLSCIRFVHRHPEPSVGMIADGLGVSDAAAAKLIDRLVKKQLLIREEDPKDRRVLKIKLTEAGEKLLEGVCAAESNNFAKILKRMPTESRLALEKGMTAFLTAALEKPEHIDEICLKCGWSHDLDCPGNVRYRDLTGHDKGEV
ncbi:MAG: MarR family transcriptional regulator [Firmicutes bacterium]|nr:MarR family transcriptional regulator [Bacillota bacterium]